MSFKSMEEIVKLCSEQNKSFYEIVIEEDINESDISLEDSLSKMKKMWDAMIDASDNYDGNLKSKSGLVGGNGLKMLDYLDKKNSYCGSFTTNVIAEALKMGESNACMKRIVAAPTAGSCGVIPAVLISYYRYADIPEKAIIQSLYVAGGIGQVIAERAFVSGAAGGCQAEIGVASAMAAGALVFLKNGTVEQICHATAMALKNLLGLVCDPVAGLVEVPCVKRNVIGAVNALSCADMALAGIESQVPVDQVIDAMKEIGENMNTNYKETACGGCGITPRAVEIVNNLKSINI